MTFQRTLLFTLTMSAAAFGCRKASNDGSRPETSSSVVEGTATTGTAVLPEVAPPPVNSDTTVNAGANVNTGNDTATGTVTTKRTKPTGATGTTGGTGAIGATTDTPGTTDSMSNTTGAVTAETPTATPPVNNAAPTATPPAAQERKTERGSTNWYRSDRNDAPKQ